MKVCLRLSNYSQPSFTCNPQKFRKDCSQRIQNNNLTETNISNLKGLAEKFSNEGLTYQQCLKAAKTNPFMLVHKPDTLEYNIREFANRFSEYGITAENHLKNALRHPPLFSMSPDTIENNIMTKAQLFANDGLTIEEIIKMAKSQPNVYTINPKSLDKKVNQIAEGIQGTRTDVLEIFKAHPTTCSLNPKEIIKKFEFLKYIEQNKFFDTKKLIPSDDVLKPILLKKSYTNSMELNYLILLRNKISSTLPNGSKLPFNHLNEAIQKFIKQNSDKIINLQMPANKLVNQFTKFVENFSHSTIGKNIFKFKIV